MSLPLKALYYGQLKAKVGGQALPKSGHEVVTVEFTDAAGNNQTGFFKPLAADYPPILAKYSVAGSISMRLSLGDRAAEDWLVFDETGKNIIGTMSVAVPNYEPLNGYVGVDALLQANVAELLVASWYRKCDDRHPGNFSLAGLIDWDMLEYHVTHIPKGSRYIDGVLKPIPKKAMWLKAPDLDNFPNIEGRTHWPANTRPGNFNYYKQYLSAESFQALAANPAFQEQMFEALLKELLTFDPEALRKRLTDYFGDLTLDYQSLEMEKREELEKQYPGLFNKETNGQTFVDHMMVFFQQEYNELRHAVVNYMGCTANNSGVPVTSFVGFLRNKPSAFKNVSGWVSKQNDMMANDWEKYKEHILSKPEGQISPIPGAYFVAPEGRLNQAKMKQRYHKIWRDAHAPMLGAILDDAKLLANNLANTLRDTPVSFAKSVLLTAEDKGELTEAWMLLGELEPIAESKTTHCQPGSELRQGLIILEKFIVDLHRRADLYLKLEEGQLTSDNNSSFISDVEKILQKCESKLYQILGNNETSQWACEFTKIAQDLQQLIGGLAFERHLRSEDHKLHSNTQPDFVALYKRKHTDKEVVNSCLTALFNWADSLEKGVLDDYILTVISELYEARSYNLLANRSRATQVREYLKSTTEISGANRLAAILSIGGCKSTSLNTLLISTLIPQMLQDTNQVDVNLLSVRSACMREQFDTPFYTKKSREFVLNNSRFEHVHSKFNIELFNNTMYRWVANLSQDEFKKIVDEALSLYEPYSFNLFSAKKRGPKVRGYFDAERGLSNEKILASIFSEGAVEANSLNPILFEKILAAMKATVLADGKIFLTKENKIIVQAEISKIPPCPFVSTLEQYARPRTLEQISTLQKGVIPSNV